jgi:hypothetical protein
MRLSRQRAAMRSTVAIAGEMLPCCAIWSKPIWRLPNLRIDTEAPSIGERRDDDVDAAAVQQAASQIGLASSTRRPTRLTMRLQMLSRWALSSKVTEVSSSLPRARCRSAWAR